MTTPAPGTNQTNNVQALPLPEVRTLPLGEIKPYWRNPRRIPQEAIDQVRASIEKYGYQQPIVVDENNVIVVGHTRLLALQQMKVDSAEVYVATNLSEEKIREYRVVDNRLGELGQWDHDALVMELREFEVALLEQFFPDVDLEIAQLNEELVTRNDVDTATKKILEVKEADPTNALTTRVECPACFDIFEVTTISLPGLSREDLKNMVETAGTSDGEAQ
jgi:hypothetical protein